MGGPDFSSDLERGAAPRSIADEFSDPPISVIELRRCENEGFHFHAAPFGNRSLQGLIGSEHALLRRKTRTAIAYPQILEINL